VGIVIAGLFLQQGILYGPSLAGQKVLLPLDFLAQPGVYLPDSPENEAIEPHDRIRQDLIYLFEPARRFAVTEIHAGRLPQWAPYQFSGAPFIWPKFSPFLALECCTASPTILAWSQLLAALVAGLGAYFFARSVLAVSFWPGAVMAWCYPLTGFFIFWQGYPTCAAVYWLPWIFLATDKTIRRASRKAPIGLSVATALVLISGHLDVAAQVLMGSGMFAIWCWYDAYPGQWFGRRAQKSVLALLAAWTLGFMLAAPQILPATEYAKTGDRMVRRAMGQEERPPTGLAALPQIVLPDFYGTMQAGSYYLQKGNQLESAAATYAGLIATLVLAPLAWCSRRHHKLNIFWSVLAFCALSWCLAIPGFVDVLRLPGLNMMSHNRLVFLASFALLAMATVGLEVLLQGAVRWTRWAWIPPALLAGLAAWSLFRMTVLPGRIDAVLMHALQTGKPVSWIHSPEDVLRLHGGLVQSYAMSLGWCVVALLVWALLRVKTKWHTRLVPFLALLAVGDLLWFAYGRSAQCDPSLYYPPLPVLADIAKTSPSRIIGAACLPPALASMQGLNDVRGYDSVDPERIVELLALAASPGSVRQEYASTQFLVPATHFTDDGAVRLSPVLDMLGVQYLIARGNAPANVRPTFVQTDYWAVENRRALPRTYVPRHVEVVTNKEERLVKLALPDFDAGEVAYVESGVDLPGDITGHSEITNENPTRVNLSVKMETSGLVVLADLWDPGWQARLNGKLVPILRANHALRGVVVPAGSWSLDFQYRPVSFTRGCRLAVTAICLLLGWAGVAWVSTRRNAPGQIET